MCDSEEENDNIERSCRESPDNTENIEEHQREREMGCERA